MNRWAIIVAGGKGLRMGGDTPKQFLPIGGKPVLMRTLERFKGCNIVLVLPHDQQEYWRALCREYGFTLPHTIVSGGETRFHSVKNGLDTITGEGLVAVHDGVRPFVAPEVVERCFAEAEAHGAVVPVVPVVETVRHITPSGSETVPRSEYRLVQTPQTFTLDLLRRAYQQPYTDAFTDDASVVEALGHPVTLVEGNRENIKLTTPSDLLFAEAFLAK